MKSNVITILIDSVYSGCTGTQKTKTSSTPFIDSMLEHSFYAPNLYSYGPYTDAATKGLYCANRTLDDYGYFFGINSSETNHFKIFKELGYETFGFYYPYYLIGSRVEQFIDHSIYTTGFKYISVWNGKFEYYAKVKKQRALSDIEYALLMKCTDLVFDCWILFYSNIRQQRLSDSIIKDIFNVDLQGTGEKRLLEEFAVFNEDKKKYIDGVLDLGMQHPLAKINEYDFGRKEDLDFVAKIYDAFPEFFKKVKRKNKISNIKNNPINIGKVCRKTITAIKNKDKSELRYMTNYGMLLFETELMQKRSVKPQWQDLASLNKQIDVMLKCLDERSDKNKPFYVSLHALEPHHNISFFSFDCFDMKQIGEELEYLEPLLTGCGKDFRGSLIYQLSLRYVDFCIKKLVDALIERGIADDTTIMLVSDHGTSYSFDPVRTHVVNTFHKENYNVPLMIYNSKASKKIYNGFAMSAEVFPTLLDFIGLKYDKRFYGKSIYNSVDCHEYVITEYMGPGVPDMISRDFWISIRNNHYVIAYKIGLNQDFKASTPCIIYDLSEDKYELTNCAGRIKYNDEIKHLLRILEKRYIEICEETRKYIYSYLT
jgi:hypothetical protein